MGRTPQNAGKDAWPGRARPITPVTIAHAQPAARPQAALSGLWPPYCGPPLGHGGLPLGGGQLLRGKDVVDASDRAARAASPRSQEGPPPTARAANPDIAPAHCANQARARAGDHNGGLELNGELR